MNATRTRQESCIRLLAGMIQARVNCNPSNPGWYARHREVADRLADQVLPSGSGIDNGTTIDWDKSTGERVVLNADFHHMDECGGYCGWTEHQIIITPSLVYGFSIRVTGRDRNEIKDYLGETYHHALSATVEQEYNPETDQSTFHIVSK